MKNFVIILILILWCISGNTQNVLQNLNKYWYLREKFESEFIVISNFDQKGTNLPAARLGGVTIYSRNQISWGDGNGEMPYYIALLATEYRLLKDYGQNYLPTLNKLVYALRAIERIDKNAEKEWRGGSAQQSDLNGFFMRDDVDRNFIDQWSNLKPPSCQ